MFPDYFGGGADIGYSEGPLSKEEKTAIRRAERREWLRNMWRKFIVVLPLLFIVASLVSAFQYNDVLNLNVQDIASRSVSAGAAVPETRDFKYILEHTALNDIKYSSRLMILYIAIFLLAEAAFIMMAIKEYLQDLVGLTEMDLIRRYKL
jgi:hypothetical protein